MKEKPLNWKKAVFAVLFTLLLGLSGMTKAQQGVETFIIDTFEDYTVGNKIAQEAIANGHDWWSTWSNIPGSAEDGLVADYNGTKCGHLTFGNDQILLLGDKQEGAYDLEFDILVPEGKNGYFNIMHHYAGTSSTWAMQCYLHMTADYYSETMAPGHGTVHAGSVATADVPGVYDAWMHFRLNVDIDSDIARYYYTAPGEDEVLICEWQWSLDSFGNEIVGEGISAMNFYPPNNTATSDYYIDNVKFTKASGGMIDNRIITAVANPTEGGSVNGAGSYQQGQTCTVTAIPNYGYTFTNWMENGQVVSTDATYNFTVDMNRWLVANFTLSGGGSHEYIDLGLPSGTLWATCNVGANAPEDYGDYFAWGETQPKDYYDWSTYQYSNGNDDYDPQLTKYCNNDGYGYNGFSDDLTTLLPEDDAATANWGADWCMPTQEEWQELVDNTTFIWTTQNGVNGALFTATNGNSLFLPAAGVAAGVNHNGTGESSSYWSNSLNPDNPIRAIALSCSSSEDTEIFGARRFLGYSVRPVHSSTQTVDAQIFEPFEEYTVGNKIAQEALANGHDWWSTWSNIPGSAEDGLVADYNGTKCGHLTFGNDQILLLGDKQEGAYDLEFDILVPEGKNGYFNIMHHYAGTSSTWAMQCYLHMTADYYSETMAPGHGTVHAGSVATADVPGVYDAWMHFRLNVDIDSDIARYYYTAPGEDEVLICEWQWSLDCFGENVVDPTLAAMDFYPPVNSATSEFYIDNFSFYPQKKYTKITSSSELEAGAQYLIVGFGEDGSTYAMGYQKANNRHAVGVAENNGVITSFVAIDNNSQTEPYEFTLGGSDGAWVFFDPLNNGFLYAVSSSSNYLKTEEDLDDNGTWYIQFDSDGMAEVTAQGENDRNVMRFNENLSNSLPLFSCYSSASSIQAPVALYKAVGGTTSRIITARPNLADGGTVTGAGLYYYGTTCTLTASANYGYTFRNWTKNGEVVSTDASYSFKVTNNASYVANCAAFSGTLTTPSRPTAR